MVDSVNNSARPLTLDAIKTHFISMGYDVVGGNAVFDGDVLVAALQRDVRSGYTFLAFEEPEFQQQVTRAIDVAKEYGLPVQNAQRIIYANGR